MHVFHWAEVDMLMLFVCWFYVKHPNTAHGYDSKGEVCKIWNAHISFRNGKVLLGLYNYLHFSVACANIRINVWILYFHFFQDNRNATEEKPVQRSKVNILSVFLFCTRSLLTVFNIIPVDEFLYPDGPAYLIPKGGSDYPVLCEWYRPLVSTARSKPL